MPRRRPTSSGLRDLLIAEADRTAQRWPGEPTDYQRALRTGEPVQVSAAQLHHALAAANIPHRDFTYGGKHRNSTFRLDCDQLTECS